MYQSMKKCGEPVLRNMGFLHSWKIESLWKVLMRLLFNVLDNKKINSSISRPAHSLKYLYKTDVYSVEFQV